VKEGDFVERGEMLGEVGATGRATGPHLHYEVRVDGLRVNPARFLN
jgi:murein DD-endopeptidase MepM/ murein hydrolase activator NlpD